MTERRYLSVDELAQLLGLKPCFIRRLVWERRIPHRKIGKYIRFAVDEVEAWLEQTRRDPLR